MLAIFRVGIGARMFWQHGVTTSNPISGCIQHIAQSPEYLLNG